MFNHCSVIALKFLCFFSFILEGAGRREVEDRMGPVSATVSGELALKFHPNTMRFEDRGESVLLLQAQVLGTCI